MPMKTLSLFLLLLLLLPAVYGAGIGFSVNSPQINSRYADYDISKFYCQVENGSMVVGIEVWGMINVDPSEGYIKEYDANITYQDGYLHVYIVSNNGSKAVAYTLVDGKAVILNYSIHSSLLEWHIPSSLAGNITQITKAVAHAGIVDMREGRYLFLDTAEYPQEENEEAQNNYILYAIAAGIGVGAVAIILWMRKK